MLLKKPFQALQIIFEMQSQRNNQKNTVKKYIFKIKKPIFFPFFSF
jgi:hypothetical protein